MVKLRLARMGNRKRPFYRVVAAEEANRRDGRFIEILGTYDPLRQPAAIEIESEAVLKWLAQGAQPTDTVRRILTNAGVWASWLASKNGGEAVEVTGRISATMQAGRQDRPSKKAVARIAEEESKQAEDVAAAVIVDESGDAEGATEEAATDENAS